ncbi:MAG: AAA family ATPase [Oscillospiraceae bacterium]|nr:AAA family ATPase [Oscillospiraceae bacterium]
MRILSMTATFGKLVNQTLTLQPGMNVITAPNEWGKSTWCAFLEAMLYGIDTTSRSKTGYLADKEHYAPWSGEPMSGRMDILWQGRAITIERRSKGRTPMGEVNAYETETGLPVPELSVANCGEVLLGVERSVFVRAGFLKQSQMPVTEDEKLRRRLNELVTTGDESGASDLLAQKLKDLKNRCRFNKKGLLPETEAEKQALEQKLQQLNALQHQTDTIAARQEQVKEQIRQLQNHKQALEYGENLEFARKLDAAQMARDTAARELALRTEECKNLPQQAEIEKLLVDLQQLREERENLIGQVQLQPPAPQMPSVQEVFREKSPEQAVKDAALDTKVLQQLRADLKKPIPLILGAVLCALGAILATVMPDSTGLVIAAVLVLAGLTSLILGGRKQKRLKAQIATLIQRYRDIPEGNWIAQAQIYAEEKLDYDRTVADRQQEQAALYRKNEENQRALQQLTGGRTAAAVEQQYKGFLELHRQYAEADRRYRQTEEVLQALSGTRRETPPPTFPDHRTESAQQTAVLLSDYHLEEQILQRNLGQCQGQMAALGQADQLQNQLTRTQQRIDRLDQYYRALVLAQQTQEEASRELQRRFAPRISQRAQELFAGLTAGRYQRLSLSRDLSVESAAEGENTLCSSLWRSDGTVDQLYLALRLAVAEELTPTAPLVLDDALVRFDDTRMAAALEILKKEAQTKQVILFTCQNREENARQ